MTRPPLTSLRVLLPHLRPYLGRAIAASLALLVAAGLLLGLGQGLRQLIDQGFGSASPASLNGAALAMFLIVAALGASTALRFYLVSWLGERVAGDLRRAVFNHVLSLSPAYFETARTGDILSRLTADPAPAPRAAVSRVPGLSAPRVLPPAPPAATPVAAPLIAPAPPPTESAGDTLVILEPEPESTASRPQRRHRRRRHRVENIAQGDSEPATPRVSAPSVAPTRSASAYDRWND
jgi:hypothetical protein